MKKEMLIGSSELTILLPAFNEEENIGETIATLQRLYPYAEILVIDDCSTDNTMQIAMEAGANVWPQPYNKGNGAAIKAGIRCAKGEWIVMMDADGQHDPADIHKLLKDKDKYDMVVGARGKADGSIHRNLANRIYNRLASYVAKFTIEDLTSGFRVINKKVAENYLSLLPNHFSYPTTLTLALLRNGRSIKYIPITAKKRKGKSKIKICKDGTRFLLIIIKIATLYSPLRVFLPISSLFFFAGLSYYFYTFTQYHRFTNMSALLLSCSVIIFMMGMISEQISQLKNENVERG